MLVFLDWDRLINDEIWGGQFVLASPPLQILGGTRPPRDLRPWLKAWDCSLK